MQVLLTGGSGFLGSYIAEQLAAEGHDVRALVRPRSDKRFLETLGRIRFANGSMEDTASLEGAVDGVEAIVHAAGLVKARRPNDFYSINAPGTRNLLEAADRELSGGSGAVGGRQAPSGRSGSASGVALWPQQAGGRASGTGLQRPHPGHHHPAPLALRPPRPRNAGFLHLDPKRRSPRARRRTQHPQRRYRRRLRPGLRARADCLRPQRTDLFPRRRPDLRLAGCAGRDRESPRPTRLAAGWIAPTGGLVGCRRHPGLWTGQRHRPDAHPGQDDGAEAAALGLFG